MTQPKLLERLQLIVDVVFGGNSYLAAQAAEIEPSTLHRVLAKKVAEPRLATVQRLADAYGVPLAWLVGAEPIESIGRPNGPWWFWLIRAYYRKRQQPVRQRLNAAAITNPDARRLQRAYRGLNLLDETSLLSLPEADELLHAGGPSEADQQSLVRLLGEVETRALELAVARLKEMSARPTPKRRDGAR